MTILVIVRATDPHRQAEALRAALGLTLRGAGVEVALGAPPATALARRAVDTLRSFGHRVEPLAEAGLAEALARAARVEVWT